MDLLINCKDLFGKLVADRLCPLSLMATGLLHRLVLCSFVWLSGTMTDCINAVEPQSASEVAFAGDGRRIGYTRLREGTRIPATLGTVVALGPRRWAFVPAAAAATKPVQALTDSESVEITGNQRAGTVTRRIDSVTLSNKLSAPGGLPRRGDAAPLKDSDSTDSSMAELGKSEPVVLIAENLMLQRIVQAIREDEVDNLWQITGWVTEYFGENRLTILTAQRGQAKRLPPADVLIR